MRKLYINDWTYEWGYRMINKMIRNDGHMNEWEHFLNERLEWMIKIKNEGTEW